MSVSSRLKDTKIIGQRKVFYRQRISESSCARKETVDIDILVISTNGDRKIMQSIRITSRPPSRKRKWNHFSQFYQSNTYRKDLNFLSYSDLSYISKMSQIRTVLQIRFCSLSDNSRQQLGALAQTWQQYSIYGRMVDL